MPGAPYALGVSVKMCKDIHMVKFIVGVIAASALAVVAYYAWEAFGTRAPNPAPAEVPQTSTYATSTFSIRYPSDFTLDERYVNDIVVPTKPIRGVKFSVPKAMTEGVNLSADSGISVEWLPRAKQCTGDIYLADIVKPFELAVGSTTYSVATSTGVAAGNIYEERVYAIVGSNPCTAVRYFIHSTNIGNYDPDVVTEFDHAGLVGAFDVIRDSLTLVLP